MPLHPATSVDVLFISLFQRAGQLALPTFFHHPVHCFRIPPLRFSFSLSYNGRRGCPFSFLCRSSVSRTYCCSFEYVRLATCSSATSDTAAHVFLASVLSTASCSRVFLLLLPMLLALSLRDKATASRRSCRCQIHHRHAQRFLNSSAHYVFCPLGPGWRTHHRRVSPCGYSLVLQRVCQQLLLSSSLFTCCSSSLSTLSSSFSHYHSVMRLSSHSTFQHVLAFLFFSRLHHPSIAASPVARTPVHRCSSTPFFSSFFLSYRPAFIPTPSFDSHLLSFSRHVPSSAPSSDTHFSSFTYPLTVIVALNVPFAPDLQQRSQLAESRSPSLHNTFSPGVLFFYSLFLPTFSACPSSLSLSFLPFMLPRLLFSVRPHYTPTVALRIVRSASSRRSLPLLSFLPAFPTCPSSLFSSFLPSMLPGCFRLSSLRCYSRAQDCPFALRLSVAFVFRPPFSARSSHSFGWPQ